MHFYRPKSALRGGKTKCLAYFSNWGIRAQQKVREKKTRVGLHSDFVRKGKKPQQGGERGSLEG